MKYAGYETIANDAATVAQDWKGFFESTPYHDLGRLFKIRMIEMAAKYNTPPKVTAKMINYIEKSL